MSIAGLLGYRLTGLRFGYGGVVVVEATTKNRQVGVSWSEGFTVVSVGASVTVSGSTLSISDASYAKVDLRGLGQSPVFIAGDAVSLVEVYGIG